MERGKMVGTVYEEITLKNVGDVINVGRGIIKEPEIRQMTVQCVVDTSAETLVISETVQKELGLRTEHLHESTLANGETVVCKIAEREQVCMQATTLKQMNSMSMLSKA